MLAARAAEAAAIGATAGGLAAAALMGAWILAGRHPLAAVCLCAAPPLGGLAATLHAKAAARLRLDPALRWFLAALTVLAGGSAAAAVLAGAFSYLPKNWLILLVPVAAAAAASVALVRGASLRQVAASADRRAGLRERLSTAWEVAEAKADSAFARAVQQQALATVQRPDLRKLSFWKRTRATSAALGLALLAAALMLPWEPLASPAAIAQQHWQQASRQAGQLLQQQLAGLDPQRLSQDPQLAAALAKLQDIATLLRAPEAGQAAHWRGQVIDLEELATSLRRAVASGRLEPQAAGQLRQLIQTLEAAAAEIAEGMGQTAPQYAHGPGQADTEGTSLPSPQPAGGYATVYNPSYAELTSTASAPTPGEAPPVAPAAPVQMPYEQAWDAARRRAAEALRAQAVPARYRQLVRDYFSSDR